MATQPTTFFGQFFARLTSETPIFFKKIIALGITLAATGTSILGLQEIKIIHFPDVVWTIAQYMIGIGTAISIVAKSATTDPTLQAKGGSNVEVNDGGASKATDKAPKP
jgi:hypothetical protein